MKKSLIFCAICTLSFVATSMAIEDFEDFTLNIPEQHPMNYEDAIAFGLDQPGGGWMFTPEGGAGYALILSGGPDGSSYIGRTETINWARGFCFVVKDNKETTGLITIEFDLLYNTLSNGDGDFAIKFFGMWPKSSFYNINFSKEAYYV